MSKFLSTAAYEKKVRELEKYAYFEGEKLSDEDLEEKEKLKSSLKYFFSKAFNILLPGVEYTSSWHFDAIADHLEACAKRQIKRLIINIPPRCGKTMLASDCLTPWIWTHSPNERFIYAGHSEKICRPASINARRLITSEWYQQYFRSVFQLSRDQNSADYFSNTQGGVRQFALPSGNISGTTAEFIVLDDINDVYKVLSPSTREHTNVWIDQALSSRLADRRKDVIINIQQRCHERDATGNFLSKDHDDLVWLCLPMEYEKSYKCKTVILDGGKKVWSDPRAKEGELLWPERIGHKELKNLKKDLNSPYAISGQLQQRPAPAEGGLFKKDEFNWWCDAPPDDFDFIVQSWDTALTSSETSCYNACVTLGVYSDPITGVSQVMLLDTFRSRLEYPDLRRMMIRLYKNYHDKDPTDEPYTWEMSPDLVLIEEKVSGYALIAEMSRAGIPVNRFNPNRYGAKELRARVAASIIDGGRVWLPANPKTNYTSLRNYCQDFVDLLALWPNGESNDMVDAFSQGLIFLKEKGYIGLLDDQEPDLPQEIGREKVLGYAAFR